MAFTTQQKHFIKKNIGKLSLQEIAAQLELPIKTVDDFVKKRISEDKYQSLYGAGRQKSSDIKEFRFFKFLADNIGYFLILAALVAVCYFNAVNNNFVSDDIAGIAQNQEIGTWQYVTSEITGFIQKIIYFTVFHLGGKVPAYFRLINILLHLGSVFLVFTILNLLTKKNIAFMAAVLFAIHPLMIESITWISGMPYALYGFLFLCSFYFYIRSEAKKRYLLYSLILFILTVLSSEKSVPLLLVFFAYDYCYGKKSINWKKTLPFLIAGIALAAIYLGRIGDRITNLETTHYQQAQGYDNVFIKVPVAIACYLGLMAWPDKLTLYHTEMNFSPDGFILCVIVFLSILGLAYWGFRKNRPVLFWTMLFLSSLAATLTPLKVAWVVAERYAYIGSLGVFVIFAMFLDWISSQSDLHKKFAYTFMALLAVALTTRTIYRNIDWKNEDNLWISTARTSPSGSNTHNNMGDVYARRGDHPKAIEEFKKAIELNPGYADAYHNLAIAYQQTGQIDLAIETYNKALSINPRIWQSYQNLASLYFERGDGQKALEYIQKAIEINPTDQGLQSNLATIQQTLQGNPAPPVDPAMP